MTRKYSPPVIAIKTRPSGSGIVVSAYSDTPMPSDGRDAEWIENFGDQVVGYVEARPSRYENDDYILSEEKRCLKNFLSMAAALGMPDLALFIVRASEVRPMFIGTGLGVEMYIEAARVAAVKHRAALAPDYCAGGATSESAKRVWKSSRMSEVVVRSGELVYWTGCRKR